MKRKRRSPNGDTSKKHNSLRTTLVWLVLAGWILPVLLVVTFTGGYLSYKINRQVAQASCTAVENAVLSTSERLQSAMVSSRIASYNPVVRQAYQSYLSTKNKVELYDEVMDFLTLQYKHDDKFLITALYFCDEPENVYYAFNNTHTTSLDALRPLREKALPHANELQSKIGTRIAFFTSEDRLYMVRNLVDSAYKPFAVLIMELNIPVVFSAMNAIVWQQSATLWVDGSPISLYGNESLADRPQSTPVQYRSYGSHALLTGGTVVENIPIEYAVSLNTNSVAGEMDGFVYLIAGLVILAVPLLGMVLYFIHHCVNKPVENLVAVASEIEKGNFGIEVAGPFNSREFTYLSGAFNSMSHRLKNQFERIYKEEIALRDARIMALQSQINPHFLNNTLELVNWEARLAGNVRVCRMLEALSTMLGAAMDRRSQPMIHFSEEMMYIDAYLYILQERLGKRLEVKREIDFETLDVYVPRLIMQPIVENAVEHGVQENQHGCVWIRSKCENGMLILEIENDMPLSEEDRARIAKLLDGKPAPDDPKETFGNLGIRNVDQRLRIIYGEDSGLSITNTKSGHTIACIALRIDAYAPPKKTPGL